MHTRQRLGQAMAQEAIMGSENLGFAHDTENSSYNRPRTIAFRRKRHARTVIRSRSSGGVVITILWVNNPQKRKIGRENSTIYLNETRQSSVIKRIRVEHNPKSGLIEISTLSTRKRPAAIRGKRR